MLGLDGVHGVVVHSVHFPLTKPVEEGDGQELKQDVDKACVVLHVQRQAVVRDLADDPGPAASAQVNLQTPNDTEVNTQ